MNKQTQEYAEVVFREGINKTYWLNRARECHYLYDDCKSVLKDALEHEVGNWVKPQQVTSVDCYKIAEDLLKELESHWYYALQ